MIQLVIIFIAVLIISLIAKYAISQGKRVLGPFYAILLRLRLLGVFVHESAHWIMSFAVGHKPEDFSVKWREKKTRIRDPHGSIKFSRPPSFLQAFVICLAPLFISTWLIFLTLMITINPLMNPIIRIIAFLVMISLILGAAPSSVDFNQILNAIHNDPSNSLYQVVLISIAASILWLLLQFTPLVLTVDEYYFLTIAGLYLALKFGIQGFKFMIHKINPVNYSKPEKIKFKRLTRQHYRPKKPHREW